MLLFKCLETFSRTVHILGHKTKLGKFKKTEIISSIFSNHNTMRLQINYNGKNFKKKKMWRLKNILLNNQWFTGEIKKEIKKLLGKKKFKISFNLKKEIKNYKN